MNPLRRLSPLWQVQRRRRPRAAARVEEAALAVRTRGSLLGEVHLLRARLAELERDHRLLAAHVATLTERLAVGALSAPDEDAEAARQRARVAAVAFYEERIGRLEERAARGHARRRTNPASIGRTSGERRDRRA